MSSKKRLRKLTERFERERDWRYEERFHASEKFQAERDRRYAEVAQEREKALKIKETADETARILAREIQDYKDEKANQLREQFNQERGLYATHADLSAVTEKFQATVAPLVTYVASQQGSTSGRLSQQQLIVMLVGLFVSLLTIGSILVAVAYALKPR